ncbi:MAG: FTR1 family protein [Coriobacteriales bacterium]|nr:FTR1 family protein [Coriobacteriales bacterium]
MLQALSITLREGFEAALVIGIMLGYVTRTGRTYLRKPIFTGLIAAIVASSVGAIALGALGIDPENELVEGVIYLTAAGFVGSMVVWMWRSGRSISSQVGGSIERAASHSMGAVGVGLLAFFMVAREGVELVLLMAANALDQGALPTVTGGVVGLALAAVLGIAIAVGTARVDLRVFFAATSVALLMLSARFFGVGLLELGEAGALALPHAAEEGLELLEKGVVATIISAAVVVLPLAAIAWSILTGRRGGATPA